MASIRRMRGAYSFRVSYKENDKYKVVERTGFKTRREAELAGAAFESSLKKNKNILQGDMFFADYFKTYYEVKRKPFITTGARKNYERSIRIASKYFANTRIRDITNLDYQMMIDDYSQGRARGTVKKFHSHVKSVFKYAYANGSIQIDPSYDVHLNSTVEKKQASLMYLDEGELSILVKYLIDNLESNKVIYTLLLLLISSGARYSEAIGLTFDDYKPNKRLIDINKSFDHVHDHVFKETKNETSNRLVEIDQRTNDILRKYLVEMREKAFRLQNNPRKLLFISPASVNPPTNAGANKALKKACRETGIKEITCHGLRHTHASILLKNGVAVEYISRRLGHSSIDTTQRHYLHIIKELKAKSDDSVNQIFKYI